MYEHTRLIVWELSSSCFVSCSRQVDQTRRPRPASGAEPDCWARAPSGERAHEWPARGARRAREGGHSLVVRGRARSIRARELASALARATRHWSTRLRGSARLRLARPLRAVPCLHSLCMLLQLFFTSYYYWHIINTVLSSVQLL